MTTTDTATSGASTTASRERDDLIESLARHRFFLRNTLRDLTDEQAAQRSTVSELCLGGLIKHVAAIESGWVDFMLEGPSAMAAGADSGSWEDYARQFRMDAGETVAGLLQRYDEVARRTEEVVRSVPDLDADQALPEAPWFEPGARWSARRVLLHILAETSQHAGHADILREAIDGAKSMG
jgi:uncharacterized damage-inducible protein DinB